ncbi:DUF2213 domain-containing protein [bacterium]|nr:DUF2213 domain-containing protein [bacterium]
MIFTTPYSIDSYQIERDRHGQAYVNARIMKVGKLRYTSPEGKTYYGNISLDALQKAIPTARIKTVTIKHPPEMLTASNRMKYQEGTSADGFKIEEYKGEQWLTGPVVLASDRALKTAESGKLGVSAGYYRTAVRTDDPEVFDFTDIDINHIAIGCDNPRAEGAGISLDESEAGTVLVFEKQQHNSKQKVQMKELLPAVKVGAFSLDESPIEYADESSSAIEKFKAREKQLISQIQTTQGSLDEATGELKAVKVQKEELETKLENTISMDDLKAQVKALSEVQALAKQHKIEAEFDTPLAGKKLIVSKVYPNQSFDDSEIEGAFKTIQANPKDTAERLKSKEALKGASMDSMPGKKTSLSRVDVNSLKPKKK